MQNLPSQLESSQKRLVADGQRFIEHTRGAALGFATRTRSAGQGFLTETREAALALRGDAKDAGQQLIRAGRDEAEQWAAFAQDTRDAAVGELRLALLPGGVERRMLTRLMVGLDGIEGRVESRLTELESRAALMAAQPASVPFRGYDELTAKQVTARLAKLGQNAVQQVAEYEQAHKARATVLKAAKARLQD